MKTEFEYSDEIAGLLVTNVKDIKIPHHIYKIGFVAEKGTRNGNRCMIQLSDGCVMKTKTHLELVDHLNDNGFRLVTKSEFNVAFSDLQNDCFPKSK